MPEEKPEDSITVTIPAARVALIGDLTVPPRASGLIIFAHGSGSSRASPRNREVAAALNDAGFATLLFDLLTPEEEAAERYTRHLRFDIPLLAARLAGVVVWADRNEHVRELPIGLFGASTGAAAALIAAGRSRRVAAVVSRGGRPDLADDALSVVTAPTLLIVGGDDTEVIELNRQALRRLRTNATIQIVPHAGHLFEEPGALREVVRLATDWFRKHVAVPHSLEPGSVRVESRQR